MKYGVQEIEGLLGLIKFKRIYKNKTLYNKMYKYKTSLQLRVLCEIYSISPYPSPSTRETLAILLNISIRSVQIWFQNARQSKRGDRTFENTAVNNAFFDIGICTIFEIYNRESQK